MRLSRSPLRNSQTASFLSSLMSTNGGNKESSDGADQYSSLFLSSLSSIKSVKDIPLEYTHALDKEERFLKNYEKQQHKWRQTTINLTKKTHSKSPEESLLRRSDCFFQNLN
mmetsp:Transcript_22759/g.26148  ORF Transcript_22759/g.26148 Transcript_22759/m.26148 type:complete len:112 (+) Transcript_22759:460-795(+)